MSSEPHLQIFNPLPSNKLATFHPFPRLPKELRLHIWRLAVQRNRIIHVTLADETVLAQDYLILVQTYRISSKLLYVNSESRHETLRFYRVHIPCHYVRRTLTRKTKAQNPWIPGTLYFNPEYDFLALESSHYAAPRFFHDLKYVLDPRGVGLLNLIMPCTEGRTRGFLQLEPSDTEYGTAFTATLTQLQHLFFSILVPQGRSNEFGAYGMSSLYFNRSLPIFSRATWFERLDCDPRPVSGDLKAVFDCQFDSRPVVFSFRRLLEAWKISPEDLEYRVLLAADPNRKEQVEDVETAKSFLQKEHDRWRAAKSRQGVVEEETELEAVARPAFGFWLFPVDAIGPFLEDQFWEEENRVFNLSEYKPDLCVMDLPN